ncbi:BnaC03g73720D [Brassica napus]|uniref:BnaC03g73720D protein n=1 Tax=Brassica napus TaxID=3708 RepID=A0A078IR30_BRANA|nr:BnaC03g73720D [Brassica napus]
MTIIDQRIEGRFDSPLHLTGYFLNPYYLYKDQTIPLHNIVLTSFFKCVSAFIADDLSKQCNVINSEINKYKNKEDNFGTPWVVKGCEEFKDNYDPFEWWNTYGTSVPNLQRMAKRILSLTTSSSGCERAWSSFEGKEKNIDILLADDATHAQEWLVEGDDAEHESAMGVGAGDTEGAADDDDMADIRELRDEDFISDTEEEDFAGTNLESDEDQVPNMYGEEEYDD